MTKNTVKKYNRAPERRGSFYRLVIPDLKQYNRASQSELLLLKGDILQRLLELEKLRPLQYYSIAIETHLTSGVPHLDILLVYEKPVKTSFNRFHKLLVPSNL